MKLVASSIAAFLTAGTAFAGGYVAPVVDSAPIVVETATVAPLSDWTGFYAGLQYGQGGSDISGSGVSLDGSDHDNYGLHGGYLRDFGRFVLGGELDYNKVDFDNLDEKGDMLRLRGRAGADLGRFLPYATLGVAKLELGDFSETGLTYGVGVDFKATEKFTVGMEYSQQDFDDVENSGIDVEGDALQLRASYRF